MSAPRIPAPGARIRSRRVLWALAAGLAVLAACESYLAEPGTDEAAEGAPVLTAVSLVPDSVDITLSGDTVTAVVGGRSRSGVDSAAVVLVSPSGSTRVRCSSSVPASGTDFDGAWECGISLAPGQESGVWVPDSVRLYGALGTGTSTFTNADIQGAGYAVGLIVVGVPPEPTRLTLLPDSVSLPEAASTATLTATVWDQYDRPMPGEVITLTSLDTLVARVDAGGTVTPEGVGVTAVTATSGALADTSVVVVPNTPTEILLTPGNVALDSVGATAQLSAVLVNQFGDTLSQTITWSSGDEAVVTVDQDGLVTAVGPGITAVQASAGGISATVAATVDGGPPQPGNRWIALSGGSFTEAANWSRGVVPGPADTALVDLDGSYTVTVAASVSVAVLEVGSAAGRPVLDLQSGALTVADSVHFGPRSTFRFVNGNFLGAAPMVVEDSLVWSGGTFRGTGEVRVTPTGTFLIGTSANRSARAQRFRIQGAAELRDNARVNLEESAEVVIDPGVSFRASGGTLATASPAGSYGTVRIQGTLLKPAGTDPVNVGARIVNEGVVEIQDGTLFVTSTPGGFEGPGEWRIGTGAEWRVGGTPTDARVDAAGTVTGAGLLRVAAPGAAFNGTMDVGRLAVSGANQILLGAGDTLRAGVVELGGGTGLAFSGGTVLRAGSQLTSQGSALTGAGALHLPAGASGTISALTTAVGDGAKLTVDGALTWASGTLDLLNGGVLRIGSTGTFATSLDGAITVSDNAVLPAVVNAGIFARSAGTGTLTVAAPFTNTAGGVLDLRAGTVAFTGAFTHQAGAVLQGSGALDLTGATSTTLAGSIHPEPASGTGAATLTVLGDLPLAATADIALQVGGTALGVDSDLLDVSGALTLNGTLAVTGIGGYLPAAGDSIEVLRYGSRGGSFAQTTGLDFGVAGGGEALDTLFQADRLLLAAGAGPGPGAPTGWIAFTSDRDGNRDIWVKNLETGAVTQVANDGQFNTRPAFSPDGSRIAYADNARAIWVVNTDGTGATRVTDGSTTSSGASPTWSPDGTRIAYQSALDGTWDIRIVTVADTANKVKLLESAASEHYPAWSPDGTRIAYAEDQDRIVSVRVSDGGDRQVHYNFAARYPAWSPDGTEIAFSRAVAGGWEITVVNVATGALRSVVNDASYNWHPEWSPDGAYIVYNKNPDFTGSGLWDLWAARSDGSGDQILIEASAFDDQEPSWTAAIAEPNGVPSVTITSPADGAVFSPGATVSLAGSATDPEDGPLTGTSLVWSSSLDGPLGTGASLSVSTLSTGTHTLTLTATDSQGAPGSASVGITVGATADLAVTMSAAPDPVTVGDTLTHTVTVTNNGPDFISGFELSVLVDGDVLFAAPGQEGCGDFFTEDPPRKLWICDLGELSVGAERILNLRVLPQAEGVLTSTAEITGITGAVDPNAANDLVSETTTVEAAPASTADLSVIMTAEPFPVLVGGTVSHHVTVRNDGPAAVTAVELSVRVLGTVVFTAPNQEGCSDFTSSTPPSKLWVCALGDLAAGAERTLLLQVVAQAEEVLTTTAEITAFSGATDPDAGDRLVEGAVQVVPYPGSTEVLYGVGGGSSFLNILDPAIGTATPVGSGLGLGGSVSPGSMAMDPFTEELLVWQNDQFEPLLASVDVCTGSATVLQSYPGVDPVGAMATRSDGVVFVFAGSGSGNTLYRMAPPYTEVEVVRDDFPIRPGAADFTGTGRLFAIELTPTTAPRMVEVDPVTGEILDERTLSYLGQPDFVTGAIGSMTWNADVGVFLVTSLNFQGGGDTFFDLNLNGAIANVRSGGAFGWQGQGGQGLAFRSTPTCGG